MDAPLLVSILLVAGVVPDPAPRRAPAPDETLSAGDVSRRPDAHNLAEGRLGLHGYDPVACFDEGGARPRPGRAELSVEHEDVVYRFATEANRDIFLEDPARFEPAYGGWCAFAMSRGQRVDIDPEAARVGEGRLLLFADARYLDVDGRWVPDEHENLVRADAAWRRLSGEEPRRAPPGSWRPVGYWNLSGASLALEGYDPVSYFPEGGGVPREGSERWTRRHRGVLYRFASAENLERFGAAPERYEPQHGGWCSYAMAEGERVEVDPEAFRLTNGRLHLFYRGWFTDTRDDWDADTDRLKAAADAAWSELTREAEAAADTTRSEG